MMNTLKINTDRQNQEQDQSGSHLSMRRFCLSSNGFSFVEILIAMVIFSIGILGVAKMQISAINGNSSARVVTDSFVQISDQIENLLLLPYDDPKLDATGNPHTEAVMDGYTLSWTVADDTPVVGNKTISVTIRPLGQYSNRSYTIEQIKSEIN